MFGFTKYALIAVLTGALALAGLLVWEKAKTARLGSQIKRLVADLATCSARTQNIKEDKESDAEVGDANNFDVPNRWLRSKGTNN